jgi:hypothetical protein
MTRDPITGAWRPAISNSSGRALALAVVLTVVWLAGAPAAAIAEDPGTKPCSSYSWSVARERGWFSDPQLPRRVSGARLRRIDRAVELGLKPMRDVKFFLPPAAKAKASSFGGLVTFFGVPHPGLYQVTLSEPADIDVFENGRRISPVAESRAPNCKDAAVSDRFDLAPGDLVLLQISNAAALNIKAAFAEAQ